MAGKSKDMIKNAVFLCLKMFFFFIPDFVCELENGPLK
jgi:hypothetical protein